MHQKYIFFISKILKFDINLKNSARNWAKVFCFWDNCIWIGIAKLSLLRTGYYSPAANVLRSSPKIWHSNKRDLLEHNFFASDQWIWQKSCDADFNSFWARSPYWLSKHLLKRNFLDIDVSTFSESITSTIRNLWGTPFFSKCLKFNPDFKNAAKNWEKVFCV